MKSQLLLTNLPYNCSNNELQAWLASHGIETVSIRIIRDLVAGVSPAFGYAELKSDTPLNEAVARVNGKKMRKRTILVKEAPVRCLAGIRSATAQRTT
jgi:RNA recognition motif-containing protein